MPNTQNLKPLNKRTKNKQREITRKGGLRSVEVRREKKIFKELFLSVLEEPIKNKKHLETLKKLFPNLDPKEMNKRVSLFASLYKTALKGGASGVRAFEVIRDTIGEKPKDIVENTVKVERDLTMENIKEIKKQEEEKLRKLKDKLKKEIEGDVEND
jgi:hypothetical protein